MTQWRVKCDRLATKKQVQPGLHHSRGKALDGGLSTDQMLAASHGRGVLRADAPVATENTWAPGCFGS
jgi:hypothetical protein